MRSAIAATILIAAVLLGTHAGAQEKTEEELRKEYGGVPWEKAYTAASEHYTVKCNVTQQHAKRYCDLMEKLFTLYNETFPNLYTRKMKWEVWVYRSRREFSKQHSHRATYTAGYYSPFEKRIYTYHGLFGVSGSTFNILAHEGTHAFQHSFMKSYRGTPVWLLEGMAVVFEGIEVTRKGELVLKKPSRDRLLQVKMELKGNKALKLGSLVGARAEQFTRRSYAYAGLFVWWLAKVGDKRRKVLDGLLSLLVRRAYEKNDLENLLQEHLGKDLDALEKEWHAWVRSARAEYTGRMMPRGTYSSKLLRFRIKRPAPDWTMDGDRAPVEGECIVYKRARTGGRISVTVYANRLGLHADELYLQALSDLKESVKGLEIEEKKRLKVKNHPGFLMTYTGTEPNSKVTTERQRVRLTTVVRKRHIYVLRMQCPPQMWDENKNDFERALKRFKLK